MLRRPRSRRLEARELATPALSRHRHLHSVAIFAAIGFRSGPPVSIPGPFGGRDVTVVTKLAPSDAQMADLLFAWTVAKHVKSNAIVYAKAGQTVGIGAGQMSRIDSSTIAALKAGRMGAELELEESPAIGSVVASDAFFPFPDGLLAAAEAGVTAVIQPGGSKRDTDVIAAADDAGLAMVFTGMRHFRH